MKKYGKARQATEGKNTAQK